MRSYACQPGLRYYPSRNRFSRPGFQQQDTPENASQQVTVPKANIRRTENAHIIDLAVPGLQRDQITIEVKDGLLVIQSVNTEKETKENFLRNEFQYQGFRRAFRLHKNANTENLAATYTNGILSITIQDKEAVSRKIEIV